LSPAFSFTPSTIYSHLPISSSAKTKLSSQYLKAIQHTPVNYNSSQSQLPNSEIIETWQITISAKKPNKEYARKNYSHLLESLLSHPQFHKYVFNWSKSDRGFKYYFYCRGRTYKNFLRNLFRKEIDKFTAPNSKIAGSDYYKISIKPHFTWTPLLNQEIVTYIKNSQLCSLYLSWLKYSSIPISSLTIDANSQTNKFRVHFRPLNHTTFFNQLATWKNDNNIDNSALWAKFLSPFAYPDTYINHSFIIGSLLKTSLLNTPSKFSAGLKFVINKYLSKYHKFHSSQLPQYLERYPFTTCLFPHLTPTTSVHQHSSLKIIYWNCNGFTSTTHQSIPFSNILKSSPHLIILSELKTNNPLSIPNYTLLSRTPSKSTSGGLGIFCQHQFSQAFNINHPNSNIDLLTIHCADQLIITGYVPPLQFPQPTTAQQTFWDTLKHQCLQNPHFTLIGDFNARLGFRTGDHNKTLSKFSHNLNQIISSTSAHIVNIDNHFGIPTWSRNTANSILDLVITTLPSNILKFDILPQGQTNKDHHPIFTNIKTSFTLNKYLKTFRFKKLPTNKTYQTQHILTNLQWISTKLNDLQRSPDYEAFGKFSIWFIWEFLLKNAGVRNINYHYPWIPTSPTVNKLLSQIQHCTYTNSNPSSLYSALTKAQQAARHQHLAGFLSNLNHLPYYKKIKAISSKLNTFKNFADPNLSHLANSIADNFQRISNNHLQNLPYAIPPNHFQNIEDEVLRLFHSTNSSEPWLTQPFSETEITQAIDHLRCTSAPGRLGIPYSFWKLTKTSGHSLLSYLMNTFWHHELLPKIFKIGTVIPIPKPTPGQYRPITLQSTIARIFSYLITVRLKEHLSTQNIPHESQGGGQPGRGVHEQLLTIRLMAERSTKPLFFVLFDVKKAFDTVWRASLLKKLYSYGIQGKLFKIISNLFKHVLNNVKCNSAFSHSYTTTCGTLQGDPISPLIFGIFLHDLCISLQKLKIGFYIDYHTGHLYINSRFYVDDTLIFDHLITYVTQLTNKVISHSISNLYVLHENKSVILPYFSHHGWILDQSANNPSSSQTHNNFLHTTFDSDTWSVDAILAYNKYHKQFLIKWSGYPNSENSWVNSTALGSQTTHKFIKLHNPQTALCFQHPFTIPYSQVYSTSNLPYLYSQQFPIVMHAKILVFISTLMLITALLIFSPLFPKIRQKSTCLLLSFITPLGP